MVQFAHWVRVTSLRSCDDLASRSGMFGVRCLTEVDMKAGSNPGRGISFWTIVMLMVATIFLICRVGGPAFAQNTNAGEIRGTVIDSSGAVVPDARVAVLNADTGVTTTLITNSSGIYDAVSIVPGNYSLTFSKEGFKTLVRGGIVLRVEVLTVDAQLTLGSTTQQIEVSAQASLLQTESSEQSTALGSKTIAELPNVGLDWLNFTKT